MVDDSVLVGSDATSLSAQLWVFQRNKVPSSASVSRSENRPQGCVPTKCWEPVKSVTLLDTPEGQNP